MANLLLRGSPFDAEHDAMIIINRSDDSFVFCYHTVCISCNRLTYVDQQSRPDVLKSEIQIKNKYSFILRSLFKFSRPDQGIRYYHLRMNVYSVRLSYGQFHMAKQEVNAAYSSI